MLFPSKQGLSYQLIKFSLKYFQECVGEKKKKINMQFFKFRVLNLNKIFSRHVIIWLNIMYEGSRKKSYITHFTHVLKIFV